MKRQLFVIRGWIIKAAEGLSRNEYRMTENRIRGVSNAHVGASSPSFKITCLLPSLDPGSAERFVRLP
jgi:hypothetical protein